MLANDIIENKLEHDFQKKVLHFYKNILFSTFHCDILYMYIYAVQTIPGWWETDKKQSLSLLGTSDIVLFSQMSANNIK